MSNSDRQAVLACHEIRTKLKVSHHWSYDNISGARIDYWVGTKELHYMASPEQMATELKRQGFIDKFYVGKGITVRYQDPMNPTSNGYYEGEPEDLAQSLESFMDGFSQSNWINLLVTFEYAKALRHEFNSTKYSKLVAV